MAGWGEYAATWLVFLLTHAVPVRPPVKPWLVRRLGPAGFGLIYSALSVGVLVWLIRAAARTPYLEVWPRAEWQNYVTLVAMAREWTKHGGHAACFLFATVSRPSRTAALVTATR